MVMPVAHQFGNRLREVRTERGLLQRDLEEALNLRPGTVSQYERGLREPDFNLLVIMADRFEVSLDFLLGRPDAQRESPALAAARRQLQAALSEVAAGGLRLPLVLQLAEQVAPAQFGLQRLAERLTVPPGTISACRSGKGALPEPTLTQLARHLGIPAQWLLGA
ncbi:MAG TPA: helix-turn-helix transcriptional regulator [Symbiobacteriaceae bacterium]|nr:helix-turn-helix transcriptional regulator [Symbiobacteriaceae bacterium]